MNTRNRVLWITQTAMFIALVVVAQWGTRPLNAQLLTGSLVNLVLVLSVLISVTSLNRAYGLAAGLATAFVSPIFAQMLAISPGWVLVPFIMLGNGALVFLWWLIAGLHIGNRHGARVAALIAAAAAKFCVLYVGVVRVALPLFANFPPPKAEKVAASFSVTQLITAAIGGAIAMALLALIEPALSKSHKAA